MNKRLKGFIVFFILCIGIVFLNSQVYAQKQPIASVSFFTGDVFMKSGFDILRVAQIGQVLYDGDMIQTKDGEVHITFNDGALMKIQPFTNTMIQEREEKSGFWLFKTKKLVRRMTVFVGKFWFKSGVSKRKNFVQTPTAVCGIRGSTVTAGYDNLNSYLNMISGISDKLGDWIEGVFDNPGIDAALKNTIYNDLVEAKNKLEIAQAITDPEERDKAVAEAQKAVLDVVIDAAAALESNPDPIVAAEAKKAGDEAEELKKEIKDKPLPTTTVAEPSSSDETSSTSVSSSSSSSSSETSTTEGSPAQ